MPDKHLSSQFDSELNRVSARVMELGGLVEQQIHQAVHALTQFSTDSIAQINANEARVNAMEVEIDYELSSIIGRRQPTARDLRMLMAFSKVTANLERMGDEAHKIARPPAPRPAAAKPGAAATPAPTAPAWTGRWPRSPAGTPWPVETGRSRQS